MALKPYGLHRNNLIQAVSLATMYDTARVADWVVQTSDFFSSEPAQRQIAINNIKRYVGDYELSLLPDGCLDRYCKILWFDGTGTCMLDYVIKTIKKNYQEYMDSN